ncbi:MAG TPA: helix-turn-helix domain-containing protein [Rhizomicrobium sp.]|jgi:AcrR family transcriptional regulator|nr:helix-turn-helix domain-containing protein [Rhizomicrobium sp.]HWA04863.1 helix-turn-helix domain-containing protein [Rhizomicrobium sp.]
MSINQSQKRKDQPTLRRRRSADEARGEALAVARKLLIERGPHAVTLKAVADELGVSHTNILHHFGTAGELQSELMSTMVHDLASALMGAVAHLRSDTGAPRMLVDIVFDAFEKGGAGRLAAWIVLSDNLTYLEPVRDAVEELVRALEEKFAQEKGDPHLGVTSAVLFIALMAFGDSLIGQPLKQMVDREPSAARKVAGFLLPKFFL